LRGGAQGAFPGRGRRPRRLATPAEAGLTVRRPLR